MAKAKFTFRDIQAPAPKQTAGKTYRLGSNEMVFAPGVVAWAINGASFKRDRPKMIEVVASWGIPTEAAKALVTKQVSYTVEGEVVVFTA